MTKNLFWIIKPTPIQMCKSQCLYDNLNTASKFLILRKRKDIKQLLELLSDDCVLSNSQNGTYTGKREIEKHLSNTIPHSWDSPKIDETGKIVAIGRVKLKFIKVEVKCTFSFNEKGQISYIAINKL